ncbi:MAG: ATP-binding protein [Patulibacter sp.]
MTLTPRHLLPLGRDLLATFPAVVVQGARQVGKSTFAAMLTEARAHHTVTLDHEPTRTTALDDPHAFVTQYPERTLVIDEIQRAPQLLLAIKAAIDADRRPGRFLLTGSSELLRTGRAPDSLAGRAVSLHLHGFSQGELAGQREDFAHWLRHLPRNPQGLRSDWTRRDYVNALARGSFPELGGLDQRMRHHWLDSYVERLLQRDAAEVAPRLRSDRLPAVLSLIAANQAGELVRTRVAEHLELSASSVEPYLSTLDALYLTSALRAWGPNLTKREVGRRKVSVTDSALALRLLRQHPDGLLDLTAATQLGPHIEAFVAAELLRQQAWSQEEFSLYHFRDRDGIEVDLVIEFADGAVFLIEVKATESYRAQHLHGIRTLAERLGDRFLGGAVLGLAHDSHQLGERLWAFPISALWQAAGTD